MDRPPEQREEQTEDETVKACPDPGDEAGGLVVDGLEHKCPRGRGAGGAEDQRPLRLNGSDHEAVLGCWRHGEDVPDRGPLEFGNDPVRARNAAVVEPS